MAKVIKLTEQELHNMIQECVGAALTQITMIDDKVSRATNVQQDIHEQCLKDYIGKTFKFFAQDRLQLVAHLLFSFEKVVKLDMKETILAGTIVFNNQQINGDGIIIDFTTNKVKYKERGSRYMYTLELDNRFKPLWDKFLEQIKNGVAQYEIS